MMLGDRLTDDLRRRQWTGCHYTRSFGAAVADIRKAMGHLPSDAVPWLVKTHAEWRSVPKTPRFDKDGARLLAEVQTRVYAFLKLKKPNEFREKIEFRDLTGTALGYVEEGWRHPGDDGWGPWCDHASKVFFRHVDYVRMQELEGILTKKFGESCVVCWQNRAASGSKCHGCDEEERKARYWAGAQPWHKDLPKLVRQLKRAAREAR